MMRGRGRILILAILLAAPLAQAKTTPIHKPLKPPPTVTQPAPPPKPPSPDDCIPAGCTGEECVERRSMHDHIGSCIQHLNDVCFPKLGQCKRQPAGQCGWTPTKELAACIKDANAQEDAQAEADEANRFNSSKRGRGGGSHGRH